MRAKVSYFLVLAATSSLLTSCLKVEDLPDEPLISFESLELNDQNVMTLEFDFTDGDGNFGLTQADTLPPFDEGLFKQNLIVNYFELQNGVWQRFGSDFPLISPYYILGYNQRIDWVEPTGQDKAQDGTITYRITSGYFVPDTGFDTCRYEFFIYDRDLNKSNVEVSEIFLKP